ncbi:MAG: endonuclease V [Desulfomonilaceae bacterium]
MMIAAVDVYYFETAATAAGVLFSRWTSERPAVELREFIGKVEPYEPGSFYKRELPCLLKLLQAVKQQVETIVVDGYVWLGPGDRPGLGAHLYSALDEQIPVIGVAKSPFKGAVNAQQVFRGRSRRPLYVTAAGVDSILAADNIKRMRGPHRIPTQLKRVDELCRST